MREGRRKVPGEPDLEIEGSSPTGTIRRPGQSFDAFYRQDFAKLVALAFVLSGKPGAAVDLAEDGFARTRRKWQQVQLPQVFVRRAVTRAAVSAPSSLVARARGRLGRPRSATMGTLDPADISLWAAVRRLGRRRAQIAALYLLEEGDAAEILESDPSVVAIELDRSLKILAERFGPFETKTPLIQSAAARLRQATDIPPPPLRRTTTANRLLQLGAVVLVAALVATAAITDSKAAQGKPRSRPITAAVTESATTHFVQNLASGRYHAAQHQLAPTVAAVGDPLSLQVQWERVTKAFGPFKSSGLTEIASAGNSPTLAVTSVITLARGQVTIGLVFTAAGRIQSFGFLSHPKPGGQTPTTESLFDQATLTIRMLAAGDYQPVIDSQTPLTAASADPDLLRRRWEQLERAYGPYQSEGTPTISEANEFSVNLPIDWARGHSTVIVAMDSVGELDHLVFLRADSPPAALLGQFVSGDAGTEALVAGAVNDLRDANYAELADRFNSLGAPGATADQLDHQWQTATAGLGRIRRLDKPVLIGSSPATVAYEVGIIFDHGRAHVQISVDEEHHYQDVVVTSGPPSRQFGR